MTDEPLIGNSPPAWFRDILRCPNCLASLDANLHCESARCDVHYSPTENGVPVLIDFATSAIDESVVMRIDAPRVSSAGWIRRFLQPLAGLTNGSGGLTAMEKAGDFMKNVSRPRILLVGGGGRWEGLDRFIARVPEAEFLNSDVYQGPSVHVITDAHRLAFADESFDMVILQAVLEHLIEPHVAVEQIWRVLRKDGLVLADTPFLQAVHMGPYDFMRFTPLGQRALFKRFAELDVGVSAGPMSALRWSIEHAARSLFRSKLPARILRPLTIPLGWIDQFSPKNRYALDACCGSYFIGRKSLHTAGPREIIESYRGSQ